MIEIIVCPEEELSDNLKTQTLAALRAEWPSAFTGAKAGRTQLNDPALHAMIFSLVVDGQLASHVSVPQKTIVHGGEPYKACGLSGVLTVPAFRGKGYGEQVVRAATEFMEEDGADISLFTCDPALRTFYEHCGWTLLKGASLVGGTRARPFPSAALGKITFGRFFSARAQVRRNDFIGVAIWLDLREGDLW
ncbi:MAG TPA: GNAT family N-acetyltransferase [Ktedonobacterales bacterium]|nr:GNAT family N-acetyltransferase [Ktedonobacterales bacterium]